MASARVILDTNVSISRLLLPESVAGRAVRRVLDRVPPLVSEPTLGELAVDGEATLLVTGDKDLLALAPFRTTTILSPAAVLELPESSFG